MPAILSKDFFAGYHQEGDWLFEIYEVTQLEYEDSVKHYGDSIDHWMPGWYYAAGGFPGYPADAVGPFTNSHEAYYKAVEGKR